MRGQGTKSPPTSSAYVDGLTILSRRELSERQLRERLARRGHAAEDIDTALERLRADGAVSDARVAMAIARTGTLVKRRGRLRIIREIEQAGISQAIARAAADELFADLDSDALIEAALARRLKGDRQIADDREFQRLYRHLVGQGFGSDQVLALLNTRRGPRSR